MMLENPFGDIAINPSIYIDVRMSDLDHCRVATSKKKASEEKLGMGIRAARVARKKGRARENVPRCKKILVLNNEIYNALRNAAARRTAADAFGKNWDMSMIVREVLYRWIDDGAE
jgi:hypothetical protein